MIFIELMIVAIVLSIIAIGILYYLNNELKKIEAENN